MKIIKARESKHCFQDYFYTRRQNQHKSYFKSRKLSTRSQNFGENRHKIHRFLVVLTNNPTQIFV